MYTDQQLKILHFVQTLTRRGRGRWYHWVSGQRISPGWPVLTLYWPIGQNTYVHVYIHVYSYRRLHNVVNPVYYLYLQNRVSHLESPRVHNLWYIYVGVLEDAYTCTCTCIYILYISYWDVLISVSCQVLIACSYQGSSKTKKQGGIMATGESRGIFPDNFRNCQHVG